MDAPASSTRRPARRRRSGRGRASSLAPARLTKRGPGPCTTIGSPALTSRVALTARAPPTSTRPAAMSCWARVAAGRQTAPHQLGVEAPSGGTGQRRSSGRGEAGGRTVGVSGPRPSWPEPSWPGPSSPGPSWPGPSSPRPSWPAPSSPRPSSPGPSWPRPSSPAAFAGAGHAGPAAGPFSALLELLHLLAERGDLGPQLLARPFSSSRSLAAGPARTGPARTPGPGEPGPRRPCSSARTPGSIWLTSCSSASWRLLHRLGAGVT